MWRQQEVQIGTEGNPNRGEQVRLYAETLKTLAELNEQCLELLCEQALLHAPNAPPMFRDLIDLWTQLDAAAIRRAAACPFLLVDAGFADPHRWKWVAANCVGDREPLPYATFFTGNSVVRVAHQVFTNAWYIVRTQSAGASLFLGMPQQCVSLLKACTMRQVTELANKHASWLRPRWLGRVTVWRDLLVSAISPRGVTLETARLHGVQMLAMELRALEGVQEKERR